jgi:microcompartment protein CcmK/EutM
MNLGRVVKKVVSTVKHSAFVGRPLLLVQPLNVKPNQKKSPENPEMATGFEAVGTEVLCVDFVGADLDEMVLIMKEGSSVQQMLENKLAPADAAIIGVVDEVVLNDHRIFEKYPPRNDDCRRTNHG